MNPKPLTLEQLLVFVERAALGDRRLLVSLFRQLQQLARLPKAPPEERLLGEILSRVLMGDHCPDLSSLPKDMAEEVAGMLKRLKTADDRRRMTDDERRTTTD